jgi:antirestriction protein
MEREPQEPQGNEFKDIREPLAPPAEESWDERVIREGIEKAEREGGSIDDRTARYIASQLHGGQDSALYSLASTGRISPDIDQELAQDFDQQTDQLRLWSRWLGGYCTFRQVKGSVPGWAERSAEQDRDDQRRLSRDAGLERLDELFGEVLEDEIGSVDELGWFGLLHHEGRPGGMVLHQDQQGFRYAWDADSDEELGQRWSAVSEEYGRFWSEGGHQDRQDGPADIEQANSLTDNLEVGVDQAGAAETDPHSDEERDDKFGPRIYVASLSDYNAGRLHGVRLDADQTPEQLQEQLQAMLAASPEPLAEEYAIHGYEGFHDLHIDEFTSLDTLSRLARGIAEHGEAFAHWAEYLGTSDVDYVERTFENAYLGRYESMESYVEQYLQDGDAYRFMDYLPESLRPYVTVDIEQLASDMEMELYVAELADGGVFVFETRL